MIDVQPRVKPLKREYSFLLIKDMAGLEYYDKMGSPGDSARQPERRGARVE
jgi:hypothetical protein